MKIDLNKKENVWIKLGFSWLCLLVVLKIFTILAMPIIVTNIVLIGVSSVLMTISFRNNQENKWELIIFILSFVLHLGVLFVDMYGRDFITILHSGKDTETFYRISEQYYHGDFSEIITYYPFFLHVFYKIIGLNRLGAQYINILCWCLSMILMEKSCKTLEIKGRLRIFALLLLAFAPNYLCLTSVLLREGLIVAMNLLWFYCQIKWMKDGKNLYMIGCLLAPLVSLALHMSAVVFWGITVLILALYDSKKKELRVQKKTLMIVLIGLAGILVFIAIPSTRRLITRKLPDFDEGLFATLNEMIEETSAKDAGSSYLQNVYITGYGNFALQTVVRIFYFYGAPLPSDWRGLSDMAAFAMSSSLYILSILSSFVTVFVKKKEVFRTVMWGAFLMLSGICAWGVFNAATAMRHRDKIIGICILLLIYSVNMINEAWKTRRKR